MTGFNIMTGVVVSKHTCIWVFTVPSAQWCNQKCDGIPNMVHYLICVCMTHTWMHIYLHSSPALLPPPFHLPHSIPLPLSPFLLLAFLPLFTPFSLSLLPPPFLQSFLPLINPSSLSSLLPPSIPPSPLPSLLPSLPPSPLPSVPLSLPSQQILMWRCTYSTKTKNTTSGSQLSNETHCFRYSMSHFNLTSQTWMSWTSALSLL